MSYNALYAVTGHDIARLEHASGHSWRVEVLLADIGAQCLAVDSTNALRIYLGTFDNGVLRSLDGGSTWTEAGPGIANQRVMSIAFAPARCSDGKPAVYVGTEPSSIYRSEDDGETWQDLASLRDLPSQPTWSFPPRPWTSHVRWMAAHPVDPDVLYAGIELGGVMVTRDGGISWEDRKPDSYHDCHALATHPGMPDRVYEAAGGGVSWSNDAGRSWQTADEGLRHRYVWGLAVDSADPDCWYVSAAAGSGAAHRNDGNAGAGLYRKRGAGPWGVISGASSGLPETLPYMPYALVAPATCPGTILAAFQHGEIWESLDQGTTWTKLDSDRRLPVIHGLAVA